MIYSHFGGNPHVDYSQPACTYVDSHPQIRSYPGAEARLLLPASSPITRRRRQVREEVRESLHFLQCQLLTYTLPRTDRSECWLTLAQNGTVAGHGIARRLFSCAPASSMSAAIRSEFPSG